MKNTEGFHTELDVSIENHGSIFLFRILTPAAQAFADEHLQLEGLQWMGNGVAVEPRYAEPLAYAMMNEHGLTVG